MSSHPRDSSSKPSCWSDFLKVCIDHLFLLAFATHVSPSLALNIYLSLPTQYVSSLWLLEPRWCWRAPTMWQVSLSTPSGAYRNSLLCQLFCDPSPFLHRLRNFIKFLLSCCKWLGLSTTHGQKMIHLIFRISFMVTTSVTVQTNDLQTFYVWTCSDLHFQSCLCSKVFQLLKIFHIFDLSDSTFRNSFKTLFKHSLS